MNRSRDGVHANDPKRGPSGDDADSPRLVFTAVEEILVSAEPKLRYPLGNLAPLMNELRRATEAEADTMLREALGIVWWGEGEELPS